MSFDNKMAEPTVTITYPNGETKDINLETLRKFMSFDDQKRILRDVIDYDDDGKPSIRQKYYPDGSVQHEYSYDNGALLDWDTYATNGKKIRHRYFSIEYNVVYCERKYDENGEKHGIWFHNNPKTAGRKFETLYAHGKRISDTFWNKEGKVIATFNHKDDQSRANIEAIVNEFIAYQ